MEPKVFRISECPSESTYGGATLIYRLALDAGLVGVGVDYVELDGGSLMKLHYHVQPTVLILILGGSGVVRLEERSYEVSRGSVVCIPPGVSHGFAASAEKLVFLSIQTPPIYGEEAAKDTVFRE